MRQVLASVLTSDSLDLDSELVVYMALAQWALADRERRLPSFPGLFGTDLPLSHFYSVCRNAQHMQSKSQRGQHVEAHVAWKACP